MDVEILGNIKDFDIGLYAEVMFSLHLRFFFLILWLKVWGWTKRILTAVSIFEKI